MSLCLTVFGREKGNFTKMNKVFHLLPLGYRKKLFMWVISPCPLGTCRSITTDGQYDWSRFLFPHIKLSLCQMSCHQIWCCKEIAIIFIGFFSLWPLNFIQSVGNPSRWFREHVSSKSIGPAILDSFLLFPLMRRAVHKLEAELF